jgi:hypothetical protein
MILTYFSRKLLFSFASLRALRLRAGLGANKGESPGAREPGLSLVADTSETLGSIAKLPDQIQI